MPEIFFTDLFMLHHPAHTSGLHDYMFPTLHQPFYGRSQPITSNYGTAEAKSTCDGKKSKSSALINYDALRIGTDRLPAGISPLQVTHCLRLLYLFERAFVGIRRENEYTISMCIVFL